MRRNPEGAKHGLSATGMLLFALIHIGAGLGAGCRSASGHREAADRAAYDIIRRAQGVVLKRAEPFTVEPPSQTLRRRLLIEQDLPRSGAASLGSETVERIPQWPDASYGSNRPPAILPEIPPGVPLRLTLVDALQIAARHSPDYQAQKESIFEAALRLDLERNEFRNLWKGNLASTLSTTESAGERTSGMESAAGAGVTRKLLSGGSFALNLGVDLVKLLTQDAASALGVVADATISIPLLRGGRRFVVTEPLTQAEREVVYAIYAFERFKQVFAVRVASAYLGVLQQLDQVKNARENYQRLVISTRRARRLADAGQIPQIQVDQARQDELRARNRWISAQANYKSRLDEFKVLLGLPADADIELDRGELDALGKYVDSLSAPAGAFVEAQAEEELPADAPVRLIEPSRKGGGPLEMDEEEAVRVALRRRPDLRVREGRVYDTQRAVAVAADRLRADLALLGRGRVGESRSLGSVGRGNADVDLGSGPYSTTLQLDLPLNRVADRNAYRSRLVDFEKAVRNVQMLEDEIKLAVRNGLRNLLENREAVVIQARAVEIARRRLDSTTMFFEAGRAAMRDLLEAEEALVSAQNALTAALVQYRIGELALQRDMGVLEINSEGLWREYSPSNAERNE
ncbi:MAG: TolC family protein [Kiritimatiellae bacterium]|nr:TolC family protein [Kiritimatiellia bacterium]